MENSEILLPVAALVAWSLVMMFWMVVSRIPAMSAKGISLKTPWAVARACWTG